MKLILCLTCHDVYKLTTKELRKCQCGRTEGQYKPDGLNAVVSDNDDTVVLGFANNSLVETVREQRAKGDRPDGWGRQFNAFIIPTSAPTVQRKKEPA